MKTIGYVIEHLYPKGYTGKSNGSWAKIVNTIEEAETFDSYEKAESFVKENNWNKYLKQELLKI